MRSCLCTHFALVLTRALHVGGPERGLKDVEGGQGGVDDDASGLARPLTLPHRRTRDLARVGSTSHLEFGRGCMPATEMARVFLGERHADWRDSKTKCA